PDSGPAPAGPGYPNQPAAPTHTTTPAGTAPPGGATLTNGATTATYPLGAPVKAGDSVKLAIPGVTNPSTPSPSYTLAVTTSSDTAPANSPPYSIVAPPPVHGVEP